MMTQVFPVIVDGRIFPLTAEVKAARHTDEVKAGTRTDRNFFRVRTDGLCDRKLLTTDREVPWRDPTNDTARCVHNLVHRIVILGDYLIFKFALLQ